MDGKENSTMPSLRPHLQLNGELETLCTKLKTQCTLVLICIICVAIEVLLSYLSQMNSNSQVLKMLHASLQNDHVKENPYGNWTLMF